MADVTLKPLPPAEAIAFFRSKGLIESFSYEDVSDQEHAVAFTVAKAMRRDLLQDLREAVDRALEDGVTFDRFRKDLRPLLEEKGWWGRKVMTDPLTGERREVQLGSTRRLRTIFNMNLRQAYAAGRWERIEATKATFPFIRYIAVGGKSGDGRTRAQHRAWHGTCLPVDHPWWQTHYPPCDWECRCTAESLNQRMMDRRGFTVGEPVKFPSKAHVNKRTGEVTILEEGIGPGFAFNPGQARLQGITPKLSQIEPRAAELVRGGSPPLTARPGPGPLAPAGPEETPEEGLSRASSDFLRRFDLVDGEDGVPVAKVFEDRGGEPLPIGPSMFRLPTGQPVPLQPAKIAELPMVAEAMVEPDEIRWVWAGAEKPLLVRRYIRRISSPAGVIDVVVDAAPAGSAPSWSWRTSLSETLVLDSFRAGVLAWRWTAESETPSQDARNDR